MTTSQQATGGQDRHVGLSVRTEEGAVTAQTTALAVPSTSGTFKALVESVLSVAALVFSNKRPALAIQAIRDRLVVKGGGVPLIMNIAFEPNAVRARDGVIVDVNPVGRTRLSGQKIEVKPLLVDTEGLEYIVLNHLADGQVDPRSAGSFQCLLLWPEKEEGKKLDWKKPFKAIPLGLAERSILDRYNTHVAGSDMAKRKGWSRIEPIDHSFDRTGQCLRTWTPTNVREDNKGGRRTVILGYIDGKVVKLDRHNTVELSPDVDPQDPSRVSYGPHVFRFEQWERLIYATCMGRADAVDIIDEELQVEARDSMDPFAALGLTRADASPRNITQAVRRWAGRTRSLDESNPLYVAALQAGVIDGTEPQDTQRVLMTRLGNEAKGKAIEEMETSMASALDSLTRSSKLPDLKGIKGTRSYSVLWKSVGAKDVVVEFINDRLEGGNTFDKGRWFDVEIRRRLITYIADKAEVDIQSEIAKAAKSKA